MQVDERDPGLGLVTESDVRPDRQAAGSPDTRFPVRVASGAAAAYIAAVHWSVPTGPAGDPASFALLDGRSDTSSNRVELTTSLVVRVSTAPPRKAGGSAGRRRRAHWWCPGRGKYRAQADAPTESGQPDRRGIIVSRWAVS
jgi:hypothetical protein